MKVVLFGATGMVGQGVLRECLLDPDVTEVVSVVRRPTGAEHRKLRELVHGDFYDFTAAESALDGANACFFTLGVSAMGMTEEQYDHVTYGITMAAARTLVKLNPEITFVYVSGTGTDSTERGKVMWARVKGRTENALLALIPNAYMFRPGTIQPMHGEKSKVAWYAWFYVVAKPFLPLVRRLFPNSMSTTVQIGKAMLRVAKSGAPKRVLEIRDINALAPPV